MATQPRSRNAAGAAKPNGLARCATAASLARRLAVAVGLSVIAAAANAGPAQLPPLDKAPPAVAAAAMPAGTPVAISAKLAQDATTAKLSFDLSAPIAASAFVLADPDRIIVELPQVNFQIDPRIGRLPHAAAEARKARTGLVSAFRFGLFAPGRSRIVVDLAAPARIVRAQSVRIAADKPSRLVIELAATDAAAFRTAAAVSARAEAARADAARQAAPAAAVPASSRPVIVLDPGHGGIDGGAVGLNGIPEKDVVFAFASALARKLQDSGRYQVSMTRSSDVFMSLDDRVQAARDAHASLFVSIHADILSDPRVAGVTVYTVSDRASDAEAARIAETENKADAAGGLAPAGADGSQVADILFDLTRRETRTYAHVFSRTLMSYLKDATKLNNNPVRSAGFVVLKAPEIPSVLIELGYLSSASDLQQLESAQWRDKAGDSLLAAIDRFFAGRQQASQAAAQRPAALPGRTETVSVQPQPGEIPQGSNPWGNVHGASAPH